MHDIKFIREHPEAFDAALARRGLATQAQDLMRLDAEKRGKLTELQALQARRNEIAKQIPEVKRAGGDAAPLIAEGNLIKERIAAAGTYTLIAEGGTYSYSGNNANLIYSPLAALEDALSRIPNLLAADVPDGKDESANCEIRRWGDAPTMTNPKDHVALGEALGMMDFATAAKISGARFVVLKSALARL
ncbi:MAG: serine--tRNA ligase, partial [Alphaproteobacteria bacterium]